MLGRTNGGFRDKDAAVTLLKTLVLKTVEEDEPQCRTLGCILSLKELQSFCSGKLRPRPCMDCPPALY